MCACLLVRACMWVPERVGVCMCVRAYSHANPTRNAYALYCDVICGPLPPPGHHYICRHYLINGAIFGKESLNIKCVFLLSLQLLSKTFLILRIN